MHTKDRGTASTLGFCHALKENGFSGILTPLFDDNLRYDLAIDDGNVIARFQVKTGRTTKDVTEIERHYE